MLKLKDDDGIIQAQIQIIPTQLTLDDINHLWATQNNTPYRLSLAYEFALLPFPMKTRVDPAPRVSAVSLGIRTPEHHPEKEIEKRLFTPRTPIIHVDIERTDWAPHICLLDEKKEPTYTLGGYDPSDEISLIIIGDKKKEISLEWEVWNQTDRIWQKGVIKDIFSPCSASLPKDAASLASLAIQVKVPLLKDNEKGQALLRATRSIDREGSAPIKLTSNPVLITTAGDLL